MTIRRPMPTPDSVSDRAMTRRALFGRSAQGLGVAALSTLLERSLLARNGMDNASLPHFPAKAKRVIYLLMNGAPPHIDMFDYKPTLEKWRGREIPDSVHQNQRVSTMTQGAAKLVLPAFTKFGQHGDSGAWVCDFLPYTAKIVDELCFIKSMHTSAVNHAPAITFFLTLRDARASKHGCLVNLRSRIGMRGFARLRGHDLA